MFVLGNPSAKAQKRQASAVLIQDGTVNKAMIVGNIRTLHYKIEVTDKPKTFILHTENNGFPFLYVLGVDSNNIIKRIDVSQPFTLNDIRWMYIFFSDIDLENRMLNYKANQLGKDVVYNARLLVGGLSVSEGDVRYIHNKMGFSCRTNYGVVPIIVEFFHK